VGHEFSLRPTPRQVKILPAVTRILTFPNASTGENKSLLTQFRHKGSDPRPLRLFMSTPRLAYPKRVFCRASDRMVKVHIRDRKKWAALVCLVAVFLLQAPFVRAAWLSS